MRGIYDRSSLKGDFLVILEDQTSEDFERFAPERQFCDYIEGRVYMPSPVSQRHQEQVGFFHHLLVGFRGVSGLAGGLMGPAVLRIDQEHKPEPDVFVLPGPDDSPGLPAIFAMEVISPPSRSNDLGRKVGMYKAAGIPEIWTLDEYEHELIVERRLGDMYSREVFESGRVASSSMPGFWIDLGWLWADRLPLAPACLPTILAGPPA
ncbi:MAG: hypothetical protein JWN86_1691 [Planctomycetota bacterium]|nr:hypothetical protein [Planctomycetota bacterium]